LGFVFLAISGIAGRMEVQTELDTARYLNAPTHSLTLMLEDMRTPGYPLFLDMIESTGGLQITPWVQGGIWLCSVGAFMAALAAWRIRPVSLAAVAIGLINHQFLHYWARLVLSDSQAMSLAMIATACCMESLRGARTSWRDPWLWLTVIFTFAAILTRPAFLFLLVLWPLVFGWWRWSEERRTLLASLAEAIQVAVQCCVPLVLYSTMRWALVGHFGLVSFGGYNIIGITGQFLQTEDIPMLSPDLQETAQEILKRRDQSAIYALQQGDRFWDMLERFNPMVWQIAAPIFEEKGISTLETNRQLTRLSRQLIGLHWQEYAWWLLANGRHGMRLTAMLVGASPGLRLLIAIGIAWVAWCYLPLNRLRKEPAAIRAEINSYSGKGMRLLLWMAIGMVCGNVLLVILVEPTIERYMAVSSVLPTALAALAVEKFFRDIDPRQ
jgi:hypothetical protein